jgi:hypothetical protein
MEREGWTKFGAEFQEREAYRHVSGGGVWLNGNKWRWHLKEGELFDGEEDTVEEAMLMVEDGKAAVHMETDAESGKISYCGAGGTRYGLDKKPKGKKWCRKCIAVWEEKHGESWKAGESAR